MWVRVLAFALLCLTAAFLTWPIWKAALRQRRRERWPRVVGKVLEQRMRDQGNRVYLEYLVAYEYGGEAMQRVCRDWHGGWYTRDPDTAAREHLQGKLDLFTPGEGIELTVNPDAPGTVFYRRGRTWPLTALAVVVTLVFLALIAVLAPVIFQAP